MPTVASGPLEPHVNDAATARIETPIGLVAVTSRDGAIVRVTWTLSADPGSEPVADTHGEADPLLAEACAQLTAYFDRQLTRFDLPLAPAGSPFHQQVFDAMSAIPYGSTRSYGEIANDLQGFAQAVGQACGANPIPIIIPCHRVLAANGIGGFSAAGGIETKIQLLQLEGGFPYLL